MNKLTIALILNAIVLVAATNSANAKPKKYEFDKYHTTIFFAINHLGFSDKIGRFKDYDGSFVFDDEKPENSSVEITLKPSGIDTFVPLLDKILQEKTWFNSKEYPEIKFKSSNVIIESSSKKATVVGQLEFLGQKKNVRLNVIFNKAGKHFVTGKLVAGFSGDAVIKRSSFGMNNSIPLVGDDVKVNFEVEGIQVSN